MRRYNLTAKMYDARYLEEQEAKYVTALECAAIDGGAVLDVGCGTGLLFDHTAARVDVLVGVDLAKKLLLLAKERARKFEDVYLVQADADYLPFKLGFFRAVFAFTVLQNMPKPSESLLEIKRVAKLDASIVVTGLKKTFSLQALRNLLEDAGLHPLCIVDRYFLKCYVAVSCLVKKPC